MKVGETIPDNYTYVRYYSKFLSNRCPPVNLTLSLPLSRLLGHRWSRMLQLYASILLLSGTCLYFGEIIPNLLPLLLSLPLSLFVHLLKFISS